MAKRKPKPKVPHPMDLKLGARIREVRLAAKLTRKDVGMECGVTAAQINKYETALDRVSWSRLTEIAKALDISLVKLICPLVERKDHRSS